MPAVIAVIVGLAGLAIGAAVGYYARRQSQGASLQQAEEQASRLLAEAESKSKDVLLEAKEEALCTRNTLEEELRERRAEAGRIEQRLVQKEENLDRKTEALDRRD